jgi:hypothetical protein
MVVPPTLLLWMEINDIITIVSRIRSTHSPKRKMLS